MDDLPGTAKLEMSTFNLRFGLRVGDMNAD
jgi:hypothetical protein